MATALPSVPPPWQHRGCGCGRTTAEIAGNRLLELLPGGRGVPRQRALNGHDHPRRAKSALIGIILDKGLLDWMELVAVGEAFNRLKRLTISLNRQKMTAKHRPPL
jgi:hypothetical protein